MSIREPPRSRPFLMELLIVAALVWAAAHWMREGPDPADRIVSTPVQPDPQATGAIAPPRPPASPEPRPDDPDIGALRSVFGAIELLGRR